MTTRSGASSNVSGSTCSSTMIAQSSAERYAASVARPSGGNSEYLMGRQYGSVASVSAGRMNFTVSGRDPDAQPSLIAHHRQWKARGQVHRQSDARGGGTPRLRHPG